MILRLENVIISGNMGLVLVALALRYIMIVVRNTAVANLIVKLVVIAADASTGYVFKLTGLPFGSPPDGYTYYVSEETVPGYQSPKYFKVVENSLSQAMGASRIEDGGTICNDQIGYELPQTGGTGTALFTALGGFMTATAGVILTLASRRRKRKAAEG